MKGPAVETTEATLAEIKALLDELLECTAECVRLGNPLAKESTSEIKDRWRRETAEQAPACLSSVRAATVHVSVDLTAEYAGVIGATPTRCSTTSPRGVAHEAVGCLAADHEEFGVPLSSSETPTMRTPHQMLDGMPLPDNVLTHVGGISLFFELGLEMPSRVEYDTDARQCLTLLLGSRHILFVDGTYDATPPKWPLQEHNKMWQWFGELPPWGRSGFSPGQDGIKSLYHVFRKWSPWIHSAFWPKRSAIQVSMMFCAKVSSWQRSGFSPGIKGLDGALFVTICIAVVIVGFSADIGAALGDNKEECSLYHGPRWHAEIVYLLGFCLLDFPNNTVQGPARALMVDLSGKHGPSAANLIFCSWMALGNILGYSSGSTNNWHKLFPFLQTRACCEACANQKGAFLVLNCTSWKPELNVLKRVTIGLGTSAYVQLTEEATYLH